MKFIGIRNGKDFFEIDNYASHTSNKEGTLFTVNTTEGKHWTFRFNKLLCVYHCGCITFNQWRLEK